MYWWAGHRCLMILTFSSRTFLFSNISFFFVFFLRFVTSKLMFLSKSFVVKLLKKKRKVFQSHSNLKSILLKI